MKKWLLFFLLMASAAGAQQAYSPGDRPHAGSTSKNNSRLYGAPPQLILGAGPGENIGEIQFNGSTSGSVLLVPQAAAGTPTLTFGTSSGTPAVTASSPLAITAATGNIAITGAAGQVLAGASPAFTATPTLGASGTVGTIAFGNATSGTVTLGTVTGALGSVTASLPANTGTIAETNLAQTFSKQQNFGPATALSYTSGGTTSWDVSGAQVAKVTMSGGNSTMGCPTNQVDGGTYVLRNTQDTSPRTWSWNSCFKWPNAVAPTISTGSGALDIITFVSDGTNMYGVWQGNFQ